jgi:hypothetical protein
MSKVSFSQYSIYSTCPRQYKHSYIDKLSQSSANIHTIFGTAVHFTIQEFLKEMYGVSKKSAMELDTDKLLLGSLREEFTKETAKLDKGKTICSKIELEEFYGDGRRILQWLKKHLNKFYTNTGVELVGIEIPLNVSLKKGVQFIGFIDIVLREVGSGKIIIIDLKTSGRGWSKYDKQDKYKNAQIVLYKKYYSDLFDVPLEKITVEYQILRRKLEENSPYPIPHVSRHIPASGKPTVNKVYGEFMEFIDTVFDENGERRLDIPYPKQPGKNGKNCKWCEFKERGICDGKAS